MRRQIIHGALGLAALAVLAAGILLLLFLPDDDGQGVSRSRVPEHLTRIGPYVKDIHVMEKIGPYNLSVRASSFHMKKTRFMGFSTNLYKLVVAHDARVTLYRDGATMLDVKKDRLVMPPALGLIDIQEPVVVCPEGMDDVSRIEISRDKGFIRIHRSKGVETWELAPESPRQDKA
ncbi:MAG: hypothetical protein WDA72_10580 [Desulfomonilia bacterium]|nr:hypothetical protein [Deltaproteobacteria bacterium]HPW69094.1 hypothetical protein [Deltaproteobacteria bacterium]